MDVVAWEELVFLLLFLSSRASWRRRNRVYISIESISQIESGEYFPHATLSRFVFEHEINKID